MGQIQKSTMETRFVGLCKRWMVASKLGTDSEQMTVGWSQDGKGDRRSGRLFGKVRPSHSKNDLVESLLMPGNLEVSLRYVLKHANYGGSNIFFQLFNTTEKPNHLVASRRRWLESQERDDAR